MSKIGEYQRQAEGYKAFITNPFPPKELVSWDEDLVFLLSEADMAIGKLNAIDQLVPDVDFFIHMYIGKESALSSQIEGTQATFIDFVKKEARLEDEEKAKDVDEIINYTRAMNHGIARLNAIPLSLRLIKEIHDLLLKGVRGQHRNPGEFKDRQNWIGGPSIETASFIPPPPHKMADALSDLEKFMHIERPKIPKLIKAGLVHAQFETIHPFLDGNGRIGRLLITFYLYKEGVLRRPLLYLSEFFKQNRNAYYDKLNAYRFEDGVENWLKFFLEGVKKVSNEAAETARKITALRERHIAEVSKFGRTTETALLLLNKLYSQPIVDPKGVAKVAALSSKTAASNLIEKFVASGILKEITGKERNRRYIYEEYLNQFTAERIV